MLSWSKYLLTKGDGLIGLQLKDIKFNEKNIFLNQLYDNNIINNNTYNKIRIKLYSLIFSQRCI